MQACVLINSTRLHFRNSKWQWMRLLLSKSEMKSRNDVEQTRGTRQLIQSGLTRLQSQQPHQLLCPKMDENISKTEQNKTETKQLERRDFVDWHRLVLAWCRQDVLSLWDQWVEETSTSLCCSQWHYELLSDIWVSFFRLQPCSTIAQSPLHLVIFLSSGCNW